MANNASVNQFTVQTQSKETFSEQLDYESMPYALMADELSMVAGGQVVVNTV